MVMPFLFPATATRSRPLWELLRGLEGWKEEGRGRQTEAESEEREGARDLLTSFLSIRKLMAKIAGVTCDSRVHRGTPLSSPIKNKQSIKQSLTTTSIHQALYVHQVVNYSHVLLGTPPTEPNCRVMAQLSLSKLLTVLVCRLAEHMVSRSKS